MSGLFSFAGESDDPCGGIDEAADKETLRRGLSRGIVAHLGIKLIRPHHVTALTIKAERDELCQLPCASLITLITYL